MALKIEFEGYVNEVKTFGWGTVLKMSHSQRAKNAASGQWETVGKDYLDVVLPEGFNPALINEGIILNVVGTFKVETYDKRDGDKGIALKVRATSVEPVERNSYSNKPDYAAKPVNDASANLAAAGAEALDMPF